MSRKNSIKKQYESPQNSEEEYSDTNSEHSEGRDLENEAPEELVNKVKEFIRLDNLLSEKQKEIKDIRTEKKEIEDYLIENLEQLGESAIEISDGKLIKNKSETKAPISSTIFRQAMENEQISVDKINEIIQKVDNLRPKTERKYIKRTHIRKAIKKINTKNIKKKKQKK